MKKLIFFCLMISFLMISCKQSKKGSDNMKSKSSDDDTSTACFSSYEIYKETAYLWQQSWVSYYNEFTDSTYVSSPKLHFDGASVQALYDEVSTKPFPGILMYYIMLNEDDPYPSLAIKNTVSCLLDEEGSIIMTPYDGGATIPISEEALHEGRILWDLHGANNDNVFTDLDGYNYSWQKIIDLMNASPASSGFYIHYGLRTTEPDEMGYLESPTDSITGSVIYCNVLYGSRFENAPNAALLDFAMPCPTYCGGEELK